MRTRTLMTLLLLSVPLDAQARRVEHEPNDTPAQADAIACGDQIDGTLLAGDADWFAFTLAANQLLQLCTSGGTPSQTTDTVLELYDGTGTQLLARNDDAGGTRGVSSTLLLSLAAGSYYARVRHFSVLGTGAYQLDCACLPPQTIGRHEGPEPNDSPGSGGTPTAVPADGQVAGTIGTPGDADWYGFTLPTRAGFIATVADGCAPPQLLDAQLRLLRENPPGSGTFVQVGDVANAPNSQRASLVQNLPPGTFYLEVRDPSLPPTLTGNYVLELQSLPMPGTAVAEGPEPNASALTATPLPFGAQGRGTIAPGGDADWWLLAIAQPTTVQIETGPGASSPLSDTTLRLRTLAGDLVLTSTDIAPGNPYSRLTLLFPTADRWILEVTGALPSLTGSYVLDVGAAPATFIPAAYLLTGSGCAGSAGTPMLHLPVGETPLLGTLFTRTIANAPPGAAVLLCQGFSGTLGHGNVPLPFDLGALGAPGCLLRADPVAVTLAVATAAGTVPWYSPLPAIPSLRGLLVYEQAAVLDPNANALGITVTAGGTALLGDRAW